MKTFQLTPANGRKSFGDKCHVLVRTNSHDEVISDLISYNTHVASYNHNTNIITVNGYFSLATTTHINAFLKYYGFDQCTKKEMEKYYGK